MSNNPTDMPWGAIFKRTAQAATVVFVTLTGLVAAGLQQERREKAESLRFRWTDKNRWE